MVPIAIVPRLVEVMGSASLQPVLDYTFTDFMQVDTVHRTYNGQCTLCT